MLTFAMAAAPLVHAQNKAPAKAAKPATSAGVNKGKGAKAVKAVKAQASPTKAARAAASERRQTSARKSMVRLEPASPSFGHLYGLQNADDLLDLKSSVALVIDQDTNEVLFSKNPNAVLPIASITKLMTALVVIEAGLPLDETLVVDQDDVSATVGSSSRLRVGTQLSRGEMLHLALMSSENRAAHVLGRTYPGGIRTFMTAMNTKAQTLGMRGTRYVEPTGLSPDNQSTAEDLTRLVRAAPDAAALKPDEDSVVPESVAVTIANQLGEQHPTY